MKFSKIIGKVDDKLVNAAEEKLSQIFLELGTRYDNDHVGSGMGGDPLIFTLMYPVEHICTLNMPTAATDGKRYYWNPKFVLKQSKIGLRIIAAHEAWHAIYMHPQRRGSRLPKLWNIAVDYIVNGTVMDDFKARKKDPTHEFTTHLGKFMTLSQYAEMLKNPFKKQEGFEGLKEEASGPEVKLPAPNEDRELTDEEIKELEKRENREKFYFADPDLSEEMRRPENIYDYLYALLPKCPKCGTIGVYKKPDPKKDKKDKKDPNAKGNEKGKGKKGKKDKDKGDGEKSDQHEHDHGDGEQCDCPGQGQGDKGDQGNEPGDGEGKGQGQGDSDQPGDCCGGCGGGLDIFGLGGTLDDHMDTEETQEKLAKRIADAMHAAAKMAGHIPAALEDELGKLTAPKITWQDIIRTRLLKARAGNGRNDWTRFRTRPMFSGLLVPKRRSYFASFGCLLDTSGSMSQDDMAYGISQLTALDEKAEGTVTCGDAAIYWDQSLKIRKANAEELSKIKVVGRGGTMFAEYFTDYEKHIGKCDFLVIVTDGYLLDSDVANMKNPGIEVYWLLTAASNFKAPFGKVYELKD